MGFGRALCGGLQVYHQGFFHLVVATMVVVMIGGMCRYDDASHLSWWNVRFLEAGVDSKYLSRSARMHNSAKGAR